MSTKEVGERGENLACEYLVNKGYKILERNCVLFCGEIDIIARKRWGLLSDKTIHFIEVKSLSHKGRFYHESAEGFFPEQRVDYRKQDKYRKLMEVWLEKNKFPQNHPYQMDIVAISGTEINYFENVVAG